MSADNWDMCPQCKVNAEVKQSQLLVEAGKAYGTVSPEEYIGLAKVAALPIQLEDTLREDYWQGMNEDGRYSCSYRCSCSICGFSYEYKFTEQVKLKGATQ